MAYGVQLREKPNSFPILSADVAMVLNVYTPRATSLSSRDTGRLTVQHPALLALQRCLQKFFCSVWSLQIGSVSLGRPRSPGDKTSPSSHKSGIFTKHTWLENGRVHNVAQRLQVVICFQTRVRVNVGPASEPCPWSRDGWSRLASVVRAVPAVPGRMVALG